MTLNKSDTPATPVQRVFAAEADYGTALSLAVAYESLPRCPAALPCSDPAVVKAIRAADDHAYVLLQAAEDAVRNRDTSADKVKQAVDVANVAVRAFKDLARLHSATI